MKLKLVYVGEEFSFGLSDASLRKRQDKIFSEKIKEVLWEKEDYIISSSQARTCNDVEKAVFSCMGFCKIHRNAVIAINMQSTEVMLGARMCLQACIKGLEGFIV